MTGPDGVKSMVYQGLRGLVPGSRVKVRLRRWARGQKPPNQGGSVNRTRRVGSPP